MPEGVNPTLQMPGYSAPRDIPGQARKLATLAADGQGEAGSEQAAANRLFRTKEEDAYTATQPRRVNTIADVTRGLGLDRAMEMRVQGMIESTRADFTNKGGTQRSFLAANGLTDTLRKMRGVPSEVRMELTKRARAFWRNTQTTDYGKVPTVRAPQRTQARADLDITTKSGVRFVVRDPLMKKMGPLSQARAKELREAPRKPDAPMPTRKPKTAAPNIAESAPAPGGAAPAAPARAQGGAGVAKPPPGYSPIPHSAKGGFRMQTGDGWSYWYPGSGVTSTPHPADAGKARAGRAVAEGKGAAKPGQAPPPAAGAQPPPGAPQAGAPGAGPPPLPGAGKAPPGAAAGTPPPLPGARPGEAPETAKARLTGGLLPAMAAASKTGKLPPPAAGAPGAPPPAAGAGAAPPGAPEAGAPQAAAAGPRKASEQPQVTKDASGEKRQFHPDVHAHVPAGKENDHQHHANEHQKHKAMKAQAVRQGDEEKAKAHTYAMNFHADKHNKLLAESQGREYKPKQQYPGADAGEGDAGAEQPDDGTSTIAAQFDRSGKPGKNGQPSSAADPRERFVPESESVKGMRESIGKAMNVMADLSQAHDNLAAMKVKRLEAKKSGHPLARRMVSQIDAEIAATKHDIVQLEDAHNHAMQAVMQSQAQMRSEKIKSNPIFQAFMNAMQSLSGLSQKVGASLSEGASNALEGVKGALADRAQKKTGDAFDQATAQGVASDADPESGEVKPLGVSKDDINAKFGDPEAAAKEQGRAQDAKGVLAKLGTEAGDEADPSDVEAMPDEAEAEPASPDSEADAAVSSIFGIGKDKAAADSKKQAEGAKFEGDLAAARNDRDTNERKGVEAANRFAERTKGRNDRSVMRAQLGEDDNATATSAQSGVRAKVSPTSEQGTIAATGHKKKKLGEAATVAKSLILVKSAEWREVVRLAPKMDNQLRKSLPAVQFVAPLRIVAKVPMSFLDLYG